MANYYAITIDSEKLTHKAAADMLNYIGEHNFIRDFDYSHSHEHKGGHLFIDTRGLPYIVDILKTHNIPEADVTIEDEFTRFWNNLPEEEQETYTKEACEKAGETEAKKEIRVDYQSKFYGW